MPKTTIDVLYMRGGSVRSKTVTLPLRHAENAFAWLKAQFPAVEILNTRESRLQ